MTHPANKEIYQPKRDNPLDQFKGKDNVSPENIAIVVPVKDNQEGINRLFESFFDDLEERTQPKGVVIVDNNSDPEIVISDEIRERASRMGTQVHLLKESNIGPAAARNTGWEYAKENLDSEWILFVDSDCKFTASTVSDYTKSANGSLAYQGRVDPIGSDFISRFYDEERILTPLVFKDQDEDFLRPNYLITANVMINADALSSVDGFDEFFKKAGGGKI